MIKNIFLACIYFLFTAGVAWGAATSSVTSSAPMTSPTDGTGPGKCFNQVSAACGTMEAQVEAEYRACDAIKGTSVRVTDVADSKDKMDPCNPMWIADQLSDIGNDFKSCAEKGKASLKTKYDAINAKKETAHTTADQKLTEMVQNSLKMCSQIKALDKANPLKPPQHPVTSMPISEGYQCAVGPTFQSLQPLKQITCPQYEAQGKAHAENIKKQERSGSETIFKSSCDATLAKYNALYDALIAEEKRFQELAAKERKHGSGRGQLDNVAKSCQSAFDQLNKALNKEKPKEEAKQAPQTNQPSGKASSTLPPSSPLTADNGGGSPDLAQMTSTGGTTSGPTYERPPMDIPEMDKPIEAGLTTGGGTTGGQTDATTAGTGSTGSSGGDAEKQNTQGPHFNAIQYGTESDAGSGSLSPDKPLTAEQKKAFRELQNLGGSFSGTSGASTQSPSAIAGGDSGAQGNAIGSGHPATDGAQDLVNTEGWQSLSASSGSHNAPAMYGAEDGTTSNSGRDIASVEIPLASPDESMFWQLLEPAYTRVNCRTESVVCTDPHIKSTIVTHPHRALTDAEIARAAVTYR